MTNPYRTNNLPVKTDPFDAMDVKRIQSLRFFREKDENERIYKLIDSPGRMESYLEKITKCLVDDGYYKGIPVNDFGINLEDDNFREVFASKLRLFVYNKLKDRGFSADFDDHYLFVTFPEPDQP